MFFTWFKFPSINILLTLISAHSIKFTRLEITRIFEKLFFILSILDKWTISMRLTIFKGAIVKIIMSYCFSFDKFSFLPISTIFCLFVNWCKCTFSLGFSVGEISLKISLFGDEDSFLVRDTWVFFGRSFVVAIIGN